MVVKQQSGPISRSGRNFLLINGLAWLGLAWLGSATAVNNTDSSVGCHRPQIAPPNCAAPQPSAEPQLPAAVVADPPDETRSAKESARTRLGRAAEARAQVGLSQQAFADLLGVSKRTLQDWEQGRREPTGAAKTLLRLAVRHPVVLREMQG